MSSMNTDPTIVLHTGRSEVVWAVAFHPDGIHLLGGSGDTIGRWRLADGQVIGKQTGVELRAISVSRDHKWVVCGTYGSGASVWDAQLREKIIEVKGKTTVRAVGVSSDSTRFATGSEDNTASIWNITSGERLVGPLKHNAQVTGVKFSPNGEHIATACMGSAIRVFDSHNGDEVINVFKTITPSITPITPLAWSNDGQQIFATSKDNKIRSFQVFTRSQLAESQFLNDGNNDTKSIVLATNNKFLVSFAGSIVSFLDTSTLSRIDPVVKASERISSIALSSDCNYLATGRTDGKISVYTLGHILPDFHGPFHPSTPEEPQQDEQPSTSGSHNNKRSDSTVEEPGKSDSVESAAHNDDGGGDLLEVEVRSSSAAPEFDYNESLSRASSVHSREEEAPPPGTSNAVPQSLDALPTTSPRDAPLEENINAAESSHGISMLKRLFPTRIRKSNKDSALHKPDRVPRKPRRAADDQTRSQPPARVEDSNVGPSTMAAARPKRRVVATSFKVPEPKRKSRTKPAQSKKARSGQGAAGAAEAGPAHQVNTPLHTSAGRIHVTDQRESGDSFISVRLPSWMLCRGSATEYGTHG